MPTTSPFRLNSGRRSCRIDRHVGLDEGTRVFLGQRPPLGADDAGGDGVLETEGRTNGQHPVPTRSLPGSPRLTLGRPLASILSSATSERGSGPIRRALELALVAQLDDDLVGALHHMGVGQHITIGRHDETRPQGSGCRGRSSGCRPADGARSGGRSRTSGRLRRAAASPAAPDGAPAWC